MPSAGTRAARVLGLMDPRDPSAQDALARAFQCFLLLHVAVRTLLWAERGDDWQAGRWLLAAVLAGCAVAGWRDATRARAAAGLAFAALTVKLVASFPGTSNHFFIEYLCIGLLALCDIGVAGERALLLAAARWLTVIVFFYSGLQKVLHGTYFDAQFLGYSISHKESFQALFAWMMPAAELERLRALHAIGPGIGPYAIRAPLALLVSNGTWLFEMLAPAFLVWRRTRAAAALLTLGFVVAIELGARELMFGALFVNLLLLFLDRPWNRALLPFWGAFFAVLFASRIGLLPRFFFN